MIKYNLELVGQEENGLYSEWEFQIKNARSVGVLGHFVNTLADNKFMVTAIKFSRKTVNVCIEIENYEKNRWTTFLQKNGISMLRRVK